MRKPLFLFFLFLLLLFNPVNHVFAAAPTISNVPSSVNIDEAFSISVNMSGLSDNTVYRLRVALSPSGTTNYFGSTYNGTDWYNGTPSPIDY